VEKRPRKPGAWTGLATPVGGREGGSEGARKRGGGEEMRYGQTVYARVQEIADQCGSKNKEVGKDKGREREGHVPLLRPAPKPGTRQASAMEPVNRTRREETATSAAPARIARRVEEEEEEEVVAMVWMWERFCPTQQTRPSGPGCFPSLYCCCCFLSPPESPSKLLKRLVLLFGVCEMGGCEFMLCRVDVYVWGSPLLSPLALFPSSPPPACLPLCPPKLTTTGPAQ